MALFWPWRGFEQPSPVRLQGSSRGAARPLEAPRVAIPRESEREIGEGEREMSKMRKIRLYQERFCKYSPPWRHVACQVGFGCTRGVFETKDEPLKRLYGPN